MGKAAIRKEVKLTVRVAKFISLLIIVYSGTYALLMRPGYPAIDGNRRVAFKSVSILAPVATEIINGHTTTYVRVSFWNYFYAPIDFAFHKANVKEFDEARGKGFERRDWIMMR